MKLWIGIVNLRVLFMHSLNNVGNITDINVFFLDGIHFHIDVGFIILNKIKNRLLKN